MDGIAGVMQQNINSLQSSISLVALKKTMNQDAQSMSVLIQDMVVANANVAPPTDGVGRLLNTRG